MPHPILSATPSGLLTHARRAVAAALVGMIATLGAAPASAQTQTGTTIETYGIGQKVSYLPDTGSQLLALVKGCANETCMSYVYGVIQGTSVYANLADKPSPFCATSEVGAADIQDAIVNTIQSTPQLADAPAAVSVLAAFSRYWPCVSEDEIAQLSSDQLLPADPQMVKDLLGSGHHALDLGNKAAPANKTIIVFHDANCTHCRRFRGETATLIDRGWRVIVYPVAVASEESTGYSAVELALRDKAPEITRQLYLEDPKSVADIQLAMKIAERMGVPTKDVLEAVAASGAYEAVKSNSEAFFKFGAKGTPAWIVGGSLYSGYLGADAIEDLANSMDVGEEEPDTGAAPAQGAPAKTAPAEAAPAGTAPAGTVPAEPASDTGLPRPQPSVETTLEGLMAPAAPSTDSSSGPSTSGPSTSGPVDAIAPMARPEAAPAPRADAPQPEVPAVGAPDPAPAHDGAASVAPAAEGGAAAEPTSAPAVAGTAIDQGASQTPETGTDTGTDTGADTGTNPGHEAPGASGVTASDALSRALSTAPEITIDTGSAAGVSLPEGIPAVEE